VVDEFPSCFSEVMHRKWQTESISEKLTSLARSSLANELSISAGGSSVHKQEVDQNSNKRIASLKRSILTEA
jgi:hypothetical protein